MEFAQAPVKSSWPRFCMPKHYVCRCLRGCQCALPALTAFNARGSSDTFWVLHCHVWGTFNDMFSLSSYIPTAMNQKMMTTTKSVLMIGVLMRNVTVLYNFRASQRRTFPRLCLASLSPLRHSLVCKLECQASSVFRLDELFAGCENREQFHNVDV